MNEKEQKLIEEIKKNKQNNIYYKNNPKIFDELVEFVLKDTKTYGHRIKSFLMKHLRDWISQQLKFLNNDSYVYNDYRISECVYLILHGMLEFPKCKICGKLLNDPMKFLNINNGFLSTCSKECSKIYRRQSFVSTCIKQYGVPHFMSNEEKRKDYYDKLEKNIGVRNVFQLESTKKKSCQTKKEKYGDEYYFDIEKSRQTRAKRHNGKWEDDITKKKRKATFTEHYGVDNNMKCEKGLKEYEDAIEKKYGKGIRNISQAENVKQKKIKTCQQNFSVDWPMQSNDVKNKSQLKCIQKYGFPYAIQNPEIHRKTKTKYFYDNRWFASAPEIAFYIWLKDNNIDFEYQPSINFTYEVDGKTHHYIPDFKIDYLYFEIKGGQFFDKNGNFIDPYRYNTNAINAKWKCMIDHAVIILKPSEYQMFMLYVKQTYGTNYLKQFKSHKVNKKCNEKCS